MWKLVWKGDSRAQTFLLTVHHNEGWKPVVDWWPPSMPSNVTQKQVAGLLRQGSVKVLFYLFYLFQLTLYQRICLFWHWFNTFGVFSPQIWMYFFHLYESFFLLLGILKISTFHHCWLDICVWNSKSQIKNPQWQIFVLRFVGDIIFVKYKVNGVDGYFLYIMIWYCI